MSDSEYYLQPDDVLEMLPISRRTLSNWQRRGVLPFYRIGRVVMFKREAIAEALERFRNRPKHKHSDTTSVSPTHETCHVHG